MDGKGNNQRPPFSSQNITTENITKAIDRNSIFNKGKKEMLSSERESTIDSGTYGSSVRGYQPGKERQVAQ